LKLLVILFVLDTSGYSMSQCALTTRDNVALSVIKGLMQIAAYSSENLNKLAKRCDVVSACLTHFADYLQITQQTYNGKQHPSF